MLMRASGYTRVCAHVFVVGRTGLQASFLRFLATLCFLRPELTIP